MKLAYWMYAGPAHIGVLRVSSSFKNVHAIMHAPLGDDYFNVMRSMLERERDFTPVTASIVDRHVLARGSQEKVVENITRKNKEETPDLILLTPTCTSSILQEDLHNFVERGIETTLESTLTTKKKDLPLSPALDVSGTDVPETSNDLKFGKSVEPDIILADVNHYRVNELQAADRTLEQIVRYYISQAQKQNTLKLSRTKKPSVNIIGIFTLGFHNQHDCRELKRLFNDLGIQINEIIPESGNVHNLKNLPQAWFNFVPYREVGLMTAMYLKSEFNMPYVDITPMGLIDTALCIRSMCKIITELVQSMSHEHDSETFVRSTDKLPVKPLDVYPCDPKSINQGNLSLHSTVNLEAPEENLTLQKIVKPPKENKINDLFNQYIDQQTRFVSQAAWFSRSIDCQNLTGKKVVVFGDATHSAAMTKILSREMGIHVSCAGTYCKHDADWFREQVNGFCDQILITEDHTLVGETIAKLEPAAIFGTQMERHVGKRLDIPCGVISAPVHIQNFPLGFRPFLGYEGTNQIADLVYNSFNLGMEDHLLQIFGGHDKTKESNYGEAPEKEKGNTTNAFDNSSSQIKTSNNLNLIEQNISWSPESLIELKKVPGFVRGKVKRNTEKYALDQNIQIITVDVMYSAKEALSN